jgi:hypothetical protein
MFSFLFFWGRTTVDVAGVTNAVARGVAIGYSNSIVRACVLLMWLSVNMCSRCDCLLSDGREEHPIAPLVSVYICLCVFVWMCVCRNSFGVSVCLCGLFVCVACVAVCVAIAEM